MSNVKWTIHQVDTHEPDLPPMYALLPNDGTRGIIIGELGDVENVLDVLVTFLASGVQGAIVPDTYEQLGHPHHTAYSAAQEFDVPVSSVTQACRAGQIDGATKDDGGNWNFPQRAFLSWLAKRPGSGGRPRK